MLTLLNSKKICNIGIKEEYQSAFFRINVFKSVDGCTEVTAYDKNKEICINKVNNMPAILTTKDIYIEKKSEVEELIERLKEASGLLDILNKNMMENN